MIVKHTGFDIRVDDGPQSFGKQPFWYLRVDCTCLLVNDRNDSLQKLWFSVYTFVLCGQC